jgi:glycosyltransferase involved in cell wall biosynthesis
MKILWFCSQPLRDQDPSFTGSWLQPMAEELLKTGKIELGVMAFGPVKKVTRLDFRQVKQWLIPAALKFGKDGLPSQSVLSDIITAVKYFSPDLIHIWGAEYFWGLLTARGIIARPALLEIQGLKSACAKVFYGGLSVRERFACISIKEILKCRTMSSDCQDFINWIPFENEIIRGHRFISVQSPWTYANISDVNPVAKLFDTNIVLRDAFYKAPLWQSPDSPVIFTTAAYTSPFKGLHVAVKAFARLKRKFPNARLRIAGAHQRQGIRQDGYVRWINLLIKELDLRSSVDWLGALNADQIASELACSSVALLPTFVETCCVAMLEAMILGTPVVASYVGGIPSLGRDEESCLFFSPGDDVMCAHQLVRLLVDKDLALQISRNSHSVASNRNDRAMLAQRQIDIYKTLFALV